MVTKNKSFKILDAFLKDMTLDTLKNFVIQQKELGLDSYPFCSCLIGETDETGNGFLIPVLLTHIEEYINNHTS